MTVNKGPLAIIYTFSVPIEEDINNFYVVIWFKLLTCT